MCQQLVQFCSGSAKPLVFAGAALSLLLGLALAYCGQATHSLYQDLDSSVAAAHSLAYYLQLGAGLYLALLTVFSCLTVHYDHKQSIRALAVIATINVVLAVVAILMLPSGLELAGSFNKRLEDARSKYDFTDKYPSPAANSSSSSSSSKLDESKLRQARWVLEQAGASLAAPAPAPQAAQSAKLAEEPLGGASATRIWDRLQERGCCGLKNYTSEWTNGIPKSCCASPVVGDKLVTCEKVDAAHDHACECIIQATSTHTMYVLALIALVNLYLCLVAGVNAYRTFHYDEANQSAYT